MERVGTEFVLSKEFAFGEEINPEIIMEDKGITQFENNRRLSIYNLREEAYPAFIPRFSGSSGYDGKVVKRRELFYGRIFNRTG